MPRRSKTRVHWYADGGFLVRGTLDPHEALRLAVVDGGVELADRLDAPHWVEASMHRWLKNARPGQYRIVPVGPNSSDDCTWRTWPGSGVGSFDAVEFHP